MCGCVWPGHETKAMQNNSGPRYKRSKLERRLNVDVLWSVVILLLMCLTTAVGEHTNTHLHVDMHDVLGMALNCTRADGARERA